MKAMQTARLLLAAVLAAILSLALVGCQPAEGKPERQAPSLSPTEDAKMVPTILVPEETAESLPTAKPAPTKAPSGDATRSVPEAAGLVQAAKEDLNARLGVPAEEIVVKSVEAVEWPDAGLGCPLPGMAYAQVITPGYRILLDAEGEDHEYHTNMDDAMILCRDEGLPKMPAIPVNPDEILDGKPWLPNLDE